MGHSSILREEPKIAGTLTSDKNYSPRTAVIGNARSILYTNHGPEIDAHDEVVRFNFGVPMLPEAQGTRTDLVVTFSEERWAACRCVWKKDQKYMVIDPYAHIGHLGFHPSTLLCYLIDISGTPNVSIYGVDHNKSKTYYQDHDGYNHQWEKEKEYMDWLVEKNQWLKI